MKLSCWFICLLVGHSWTDAQDTSAETIEGRCEFTFWYCFRCQIKHAIAWGKNSPHLHDCPRSVLPTARFHPRDLKLVWGTLKWNVISWLRGERV